MAPVASETAWRCLFAAWLIAAGSVLGALFFSEIMHLPPCSLCWYQRIFMVPLAILLPLGMFPLDRKVVRYTLPLAVIGLAIAGYHVLVSIGVIPASLTPCTQGVPCNEQPIVWFGFVTIPLLSFVSFFVINALLVMARSRGLK